MLIIRQAWAVILFVIAVMFAITLTIGAIGLAIGGTPEGTIIPGLFAAGLAYGAWRQWGKMNALLTADPTEYHARRVQKSFGERRLPKPSRPIVMPRTKEKDFHAIPAGSTPAHALFLMEYRDAQGEYSCRRVTIRQVEDCGEKIYLYAYCHERRALRTFILGRVISLVDMFTGEVVEDLDAALALKRPVVDRVIGKFEAEVLVLAYVSRTDGRMVKAERDVIARYILGRAPDEQIDLEDLDKRIAGIWCDPAEFRRCLKALVNAPADVRIGLVDAAERLIHADRKVKTEEEKALRHLEKFLLPGQEEVGASEPRKAA